MDLLSTGLNGKVTRNSSIELLRIIAMMFIVLSHCSVHGGFLYDKSNYNNIILAWLTLGNLGVDIFVLITGYFSCQKNIRKDGLIRLLSQVYYYSILCFIIAILFSKNFTRKELVAVFLPTIFGEYWFFTTYFVMMLLSPFINIVIEKSSRKQLRHCIVVMLVIWCVIPTFTTQNMCGTELVQFIMFYLFGAYFRKYPDNIFKNKFLEKGLIALSFLLLFVSSVLFFLLGNIFPFFEHTESFFFGRTSLLIIGCAVGLFSAAIYRKPYINKYINIIGGCTFGVYLLHDNPFIKKLLWLEWFPNFKFYNSIYLSIKMILSSVLVFILCVLIDYIRKKIFADTIFKITNWIYGYIEKVIMFSFEKVKCICKYMVNNSSF